MKSIEIFDHAGKKYRLKDGLLIMSLEVKEGARYKHVANVMSKEDALNFLNNKPRSFLIGGKK